MASIKMIVWKEEKTLLSSFPCIHIFNMAQLKISPTQDSLYFECTVFERNQNRDAASLLILRRLSCCRNFPLLFFLRLALKRKKNILYQGRKQNNQVIHKQRLHKCLNSFSQKHHKARWTTRSWLYSITSTFFFPLSISHYLSLCLGSEVHSRWDKLRWSCDRRLGSPLHNERVGGLLLPHCAEPWAHLLGIRRVPPDQYRPGCQGLCYTYSFNRCVASSQNTTHTISTQRTEPILCSVSVSVLKV